MIQDYISMLKRFAVFYMIVFTVTACDSNNEPDNRNYRSLTYNVVYDSRSSSALNSQEFVSRVGFIKKKQGFLYAYDLNAHQIVQFDTLGLITKRYGLGQGKGPGEFVQMAEFDISNDLVVVADRIQQRLAYFNRLTGDLLSTKPTPYIPIQIAFIAGSDDVTVMHSMRDTLIYLYPYESPTYTSGWKLDEYDTGYDYMMSMSGSLRSQNDTVFYYPYYDSRIFSIVIDSSRGLQSGNDIATIDTFSFRPSIKTGADLGYRILSPEFSAIRKYGGTTDGYFFISSKYYDPEKFDDRIVQHLYLDKYSRNGTYIETIDLTHLPYLDNINDIREIIVNENHIVLNILYNDVIILRYTYDDEPAFLSEN